MRRTGKAIGVFAAATALAMLGGGLAFAETTIDTDNVTVTGATSSARAVAERGATSSFSLSVLADTGNINDNENQCDGTRNAVSVPSSFTVSSTGLAPSPGATLVKKAFDCINYDGKTNYTDTLTWSNIPLVIAADAPLGNSDYAVTFGSASTHVILGSQVVLDTTFTNPRVYVGVNPRPASALAAQAISTSRIDLSWTASPDDAALTEYVITQSGLSAATLSGDAGQSVTPSVHSVTGLAADTQYCFSIKARYTDSSSNSFDSSAVPVAPATVCATTLTNTVVAPLASFLAPIDTGNVFNAAKTGRTVPVKLTLARGADAITTGIVHMGIFEVACAGGTGTDSIEEYSSGSSNSGNVLRFDTDKWIYNLATGQLPGAAANKCYKGNVYVGGTESSSTPGSYSGGELAGSFLVKLTK